MNIEEFREYYLSLKGVYEKMPFTNVPDKYNQGELQVRCSGITPGWHMNKVTPFISHLRRTFERLYVHL
ncbi:hypothetical protein D7V78_06475 [Parabacteroides distasonis]|uniref:Uncharacterized protein n=1 Tax=Parabacteroides distasonis TaxID=823 RepID=A0A3L7ZQQ6_PARDI|nr:hypothetical protein [Parabacteroides distasonis]RLT74069.1 hypothetical protein D7V78_06475 [Parabacteroides distasonis]TGY63651.1 hypothetical protein E5342_01345 [Parabacteroides distasonis]